MITRVILASLVLCLSSLLAPGITVRGATTALEIGEYEGRPIAGIEISFEGSPRDEAAESEFLVLLRGAIGNQYSAVGVRDSLDELFRSGRVANARVEVIEDASPSNPQQAGRPIRLRFVITRQPRVADVVLELGVVPNAPISESELRARLNMLEPGARVTESALKSNADLIQAYLRDRGFFGAEVEYSTRLDASGTRATVIFVVKPGVQAHVAAFNINVKGFNDSTVRPALSLHPGAPFTRAALGEDVTQVRNAIIALGYLAPQLDNPDVSLDSKQNVITISLTGGIGPKVDVHVPDIKLKEKELRELLPIKRDGSIDESAIVEGERRLRNKLQTQGYFFAQPEAICTVTPPLPDYEAQNGTVEMCRMLNASELTGRTVTVTYNVERGRRFKLTDIRLEGTDKMTIDDVAEELRTQKANAFGIIPYLGYGRGITSNEALDEDRRFIEARMRDLGYRQAKVSVRQGATLDGENLIIAFVVEEGPLTRVAGIEVRGNQMYTEAQLRDELQTVLGAPFSPSIARADRDRMLNRYASNGYIDAALDFSIVALPDKILPEGNRESQVRLVYTIRNEGDKVFVNRVIVNGNTITKEEAITGAIPLNKGDVLRTTDIAESERILYATDAFRQVIIRTEPSGENASGFKTRDVIIDVEELKPRILSYGGGYSTDNGPLGFVDIRNVNLFGSLRQAALKVRASARQQTLRLEYFDPRWRRYGERKFSPLSISAQYTRDSTITRFFRSTIDRGAEGIVQRLDENGNPIDEFLFPAGEPTINRFTFNIETQRILDRETRSIVFVRYAYEDVRLINLGSLLIQPILEPDRSVRISRFGAAFVRDTRERCEGSARLFRVNANGTDERCDYSATDATNGDYLSLDYSLAIRQLGGNISFNKLQATYRRYYRIQKARGTVLAGNITLGLASVFNPRDRDGNGVIDEIDLTLPISERFFSGGSTTLRGFGYEEAGPRQVICPGSLSPNLLVVNPVTGICPAGNFRNQQGEIIALNPFTVPLGGNAVAIINLEARVPMTKSLQIVPFYDGGNVFRRVGDLFGKTTTGTVTTSANLRALWTHTPGLGIRIKTPIGGALSIDYGYILNPPEFLIPQGDASIAIYRLKRGQLHFRFTQSF
jgi:outer membrane protein insertion porin family